jgi:hypothetical protein
MYLLKIKRAENINKSNFINFFNDKLLQKAREF